MRVCYSIQWIYFHLISSKVSACNFGAFQQIGKLELSVVVKIDLKVLLSTVLLLPIRKTFI